MLNRSSHVWLFVTLWTVAHQALLSMDSPGKNTGASCHDLLQTGPYGSPTYGSPVFNFFRKFHSVFHSGCNISHSLLRGCTTLHHYDVWEYLFSPSLVNRIFYQYKFLTIWWIRNGISVSLTLDFSSCAWNWSAFHKVQFSSVAQLCLTLCDPMDCSTPGCITSCPSACPSPTPRVYSNSRPSSRWCHPAISSSVVPFSSCLQSLPASQSFQMNQFFASGGRSIGISASASVLTMNIQDWFSLGWTGWISLQSKGLSRVFSSTTVQKHQFFGIQLFL